MPSKFGFTRFYIFYLDPEEVYPQFSPSQKLLPLVGRGMNGDGFTEFGNTTPRKRNQNPLFFFKLLS